MLDAVATSASVAGTQASSADVDLLYRVESAPFVSDRLSVTSNTLKTKPYVSRLREFLQARAVIQGTRSTVHQMGMDLKKSLLVIVGGNCKISRVFIIVTIRVVRANRFERVVNRRVE